MSLGETPIGKSGWVGLAEFDAATVGRTVKSMGVPRSVKKGLETVGLYSNRLMTESLASKIRGVAHNLESRQLLPDLGLPFIPQTSYALSASAIRIILNDLVLHQRRSVLEFGAGMSTLFLAKLLADVPGGRLLSFDHDAHWLGYIGSQLERIGVHATVELVHAPLAPTDLQDPGIRWYDSSRVTSALGGRVIDAAIIDGPKARNAGDAETRSYALPVLAPYLNPESAAVFVDDINRPGERQIYERWARELPFDKVPDAEFCGLGILVPRGRPLRFKIV